MYLICWFLTRNIYLEKTKCCAPRGFNDGTCSCLGAFNKCQHDCCQDIQVASQHMNDTVHYSCLNWPKVCDTHLIFLRYISVVLLYMWYIVGHTWFLDKYGKCVQEKKRASVILWTWRSDFKHWQRSHIPEFAGGRSTENSKA